MKAKITKEGLCIDISELLDNIAPEDKSELFKHIACDNQVIKDVVDQILDGWTQDGWNGFHEYTASADPKYSIDIARRDIAKRSSEVSKREIERLEKSLAAKQQECRDLEVERSNALHAWHKSQSILR